MQGLSWCVDNKVPHEGVSPPLLETNLKDTLSVPLIPTSEPHTTAPRKGIQAGRILRALLPREPQNSKLPSQPNSSAKGISGQLFSAAEMQPPHSSGPLWRVAAPEAELGESMTRMQRSS